MFCVDKITFMMFYGRLSTGNKVQFYLAFSFEIFQSKNCTHYTTLLLGISMVLDPIHGLIHLYSFILCGWWPWKFLQLLHESLKKYLCPLLVVYKYENNTCTNLFLSTWFSIFKFQNFTFPSTSERSHAWSTVESNQTLQNGSWNSLV